MAHQTSLSPASRPGPLKLGLSLSGGGLRAALFHIGTLMALAEQGVLPHVAVISSVSGGSIVGAAFYLRLIAALRLQGGPLSDGQVVEVVADLARAFPVAARRDLRARALLDPIAIVRMGTPSYSLSDRVGELIDRAFLRGALPGVEEPVRVRDLAPADGVYGTPGTGRQPELFVNATSLNSGGDWRFSPDTMGQPARVGIVRDIDKTTRFRSPHDYDELPGRLQQLPLFVAVAASAAMPGVLHPMSISGMYPDIRLQLTDGGVHDNQGLQALLDAGCSHFVVSDAGGQLLDDDDVQTSLLPVTLRSSDILWGRNRQEQLFRVAERGTLERGPLLLSHLLRGVPVKVRGFIHASGDRPHPPPEEPWGGSSRAFGVDPTVMTALSNLRTDLDAFSDVEAGSLMSAGYLITRAACDGDEWTGHDHFVGKPTPVPDVLGLGELRPHLASAAPAGYLRCLKAGSQRFLKTSRIERWPLILVEALATLSVVVGLMALWRARASEIPVGWLAAATLLVVLFAALPLVPAAARAIDSWELAPLYCIRNALVALPIAAIACVQIFVIDPVFLRLGSYARLRSRLAFLPDERDRFDRV